MPKRNSNLRLLWTLTIKPLIIISSKAWVPPRSYVPQIPTELDGIHTSPGREAILHKLNTILLDKTPDEWANGIPLSETLRFLISQQSKFRDPDKTGVNFLLIEE